MAQYEKLINLSLLSQFLTKAKTIFAPKITASGILKGDGNGGVSAATAGTDYATPGLGLTGASVDDLVRVNTVDSNGKPTSWKRVPLTEIKCNKNLLDNWYFVGGGSQLGDGVFPINQRGQTTYSGYRYGIDRWDMRNSSGITELVPDGLSLTFNATGHPFTQAIASCDALLGKTVTFSILAKGQNIRLTISAYEGTAFKRHFVSKEFGGNENTFNIYSVTTTITNLLSTESIRVQMYSTTAESSPILYKAVKLELGSEQTLCHNEGTEENPIWVLNELPDYDEELRKCQTSRADSTDTYANQEIAFINRNAGGHNSIYRGKYLGSSVTAEQYAAIGAGTFDDLYIGDYWTINNVNYRIAAFDYWLYCGDQNWNDGNGNYTVSFETTHHVVVVPDTCLYSAQMHNTTSGVYTEGAANNPVTGAYVGSDMYKANLARAKTTINNAFGAAHILNHREYLKNAVSGAFESSGAWYDSTVELMNEQMVYGGKIFANSMQGTSMAAQYTIDKSQLPLFALEPSRICNRIQWWLRDVASSTYFARVTGRGVSDAVNSSDLDGVRPAFGIKA